MPRGNDTHDALSELANEFGKGVGNAEALIAANLATQSIEVRKAEHLPRHPEKTEKAQADLIGTKKGPGGALVVDAAVRQAQSGAGEPTTIIVYQDEDGRHYTTALDDKGKAIGPDEEALKAAGAQVGDAARVASDAEAEHEAAKQPGGGLKKSKS